MYLPERLKQLPMKSLYYGVLVAMVTTLSLSFLVFHEISDRMTMKAIDPIFDRFDELEIESARGALASGGKDGLKQYLSRLDHAFWGSNHFLLNADGVDVLTGENSRRLLPPPSPEPPKSRWRTQEDRALRSGLPIGGWRELDCCNRPVGKAGYLDLSSLLLPGAGGNSIVVLGSLGRCCISNPQDSRHHRAVRSRQLIRARADEAAG